MSQIIDIHGNPIQSAILQEPQTAKLMQLHMEYANHPSRGLTPQRLASILQQAEQGNLIAQAELFADMEEKDGHLYAEMNKRKRAILTIDWEIRPPRNPSAAEKAQAAYLTELVQDFPAWDNLLLDALDGIGHGYSCIELEWMQSGKEWLIKEAMHRPPTWFRVNQFDQNDLRLRDHSSTGAELIPFGWIVHKHRARTGVLARTGLHRILAWPFLFKNYAIRDLAELLEIYGLPIRLGKYPPGTGDAEKATLLRAVTQLGHAAAGIIPESMSIEFQTFAAANHDPFQAMVTWAEQTMSKAILGGTLTSQADGKSSTNALGKVHDQARREILTSDAKQLGATLTRDLLYPLLVLNGQQITDSRRMPHLYFDVREEEDFKMIADALPNLVNLDMPVPVSWVQRKLAIPAPQNDEPVLQAAKGGASDTTAKPATGLSMLSMNHLAALKAITQNPTAQLPQQVDAQNDAAWAQVLAHIEQLVTEAESLPALQNTLLAAYSGLPLEDLQAVMAQGFALAELAGMLDVKTGK
ncbi:DUF935 domain-containing protein [Undibacterium sp. Xuan67W]|uniref:DUF935 domain-containing protein n=1 Tax=Undibacterium sp. Xuan67W TaxID=3413057 RepID=UPI003BF1CA2B